jgi:hypothetical protein
MARRYSTEAVYFTTLRDTAPCTLAGDRVKAIGVLHLTLIALTFFLALRCPARPRSTTIIATFLLAWTDLVVTGQILSVFSALDITPLYFVLSLGLAGAAWPALRALNPTFAAPLPVPHIVIPPRASVWLLPFLCITGACAAAAVITAGWALLPSNPDSIVYRFPRVFWYFGSGSLEHYSNVVDPRIVFYPLNGVLAYLPLVHYQFGPRAYTLPSLVCWGMTALVTYRFGRELGGCRCVAAASAWVVCLTPNVLTQAISTNDEILAASTMLSGVYFLHRWYQRREDGDFLLGCVGVFLSAGTKLHAYFYWLFLVVVVAILIANWRAVIREMRRWTDIRHLSLLATIGCLGIMLVASFIIYNYAATGTIMNRAFTDQVANTPFKWRVGLQTVVLYAAQVTLTPIVDVLSPLDLPGRTAAYAALDQLTKPMFWWVSNAPDFTSSSYQFKGPSNSVAVLYNENTLLIGFSWIAFFIAGLQLKSSWRNPARRWAQLQWLSFPFWFLTWAASTRYIEGIGVYLAVPLIVAGPTLIYSCQRINSRWISAVRWTALGLVVASHCIIDFKIFDSSPVYNLTMVSGPARLPLSRGFSIEQSVVDELGRAHAGIIDHTLVWGQPHWVTMAFQPQIRHQLAWYPPSARPPCRLCLRNRPPIGDNALELYQFRQIPAYGVVPVHLSGLENSGLTWIGDLNFVFGPEWVFASGNGVEKRFPGRNGYVVVTFTEDDNQGPEPRIIIGATYGIGTQNRLSFRYTLQIAGIEADHSDWSKTPEAVLRAPGLQAGNGRLRVDIRNDDQGGKIYSTEVSLRGTQPTPLP